MKYISFAIPCYNSEAYMEKAIQSILKGGEDVEIIIVNDGSEDGTEEIARHYADLYPTIIKAVNKENGDTAMLSMRDWPMQLDDTLRWWTAMTG